MFTNLILKRKIIKLYMKKYLFAFVIPIILLIFIGIMGYRSLMQMDSDAHLVRHTIEVLEFLEVLQGNLVDAESGQRGFILTGDEKYLEPYYQSVSVTEESYQQLVNLTAENPNHQRRLASIKELMASKLAELDETIILYKTIGFNAAMRVVKTDKGKQIMDRIRQIRDEMESEERRLLEQRRIAEQASMRFSLITLISGVLLTIFTIMAAIFLIGRNLLHAEHIKSEREQAEAALRAIVDTAMDGIITIDENGIVQSFNPAAERIFGYTADEVVGQNVKMLMPEPIRSEHGQYLQNYLRTGQKKVIGIGCEVQGRHKDGGLLPIFLSIAEMRINGCVLFSSIIRDIREQKVNEKKLRDLSERFRLATYAAEIGVWDLDVVNNVLVWDNTMNKLYGVTPEYFSGAYDAWQKCVHPQDLPEAEAALQAALCGEKEFDTEFRVVWPNGDVRVIKANAVVLRDESGKAQNIIGVNWDITQLKQAAEIQKQAKDDAQKANRAKSDFLANMSHEIRTPINAIMSLNRLLHNTRLSEKQKDYVVKIHMASQSLLGIINDILDFSKIEAGKLEIESVNFNINNILDNLANVVSMKAQEKGLEIIFAMDKNMPSLLVGDPLRLQQVLLNLTNNAIKFTESGHVILSSEIVEKSKKQVVLKFSVKDSGIGISKRDQARLFQTYTQADTSTTRRYGGSGLGLSISKKLVEMMGGEISVKSKKGKGSTFFFTARFGYREQKDITFLQPPVNLKGLRVLVVDDIKEIRDVFKEQLEMYTFTVTAVSSASKAISELHNALVTGKKYYDLMIMDWKLNGINGIEASKQIKNDPEIAHKPKIILISAYIAKETLSQEDLLYVDSFLNKPLTISRLFNTILSVFGKEVQQKYLTHGFITKIPQGFEKIRGARILLVEDNEINQQVAKEMLENEGFWITIASDGREAVKIIMESQTAVHFDTVLMDLQMPVMDGFQATRRIRKEGDFRDLPIIAMTAEVVGSVRQRCTDAGMNDYISKPIEPTELYTVLVKWIKPGKRELFQSESDTGTSKETIEKYLSMLPDFNISVGLKRVNQNHELYLKLLLKFKTKYATFMAEISQAIATHNVELSIRLAHTLKGVAGNLGAEELYEAVRELETVIKENKPEKIHVHLENTENILSRILDSIQHFEEMTREIITKNKQITIKTEELTAELKEAQKLLKEYDSDAVGKIERLRSSLMNSGYKKETETLTERLADYDFDGASEIVEIIIRSIEKNEGTK